MISTNPVADGAIRRVSVWPGMMRQSATLARRRAVRDFGVGMIPLSASETLLLRAALTSGSSSVDAWREWRDGHDMQQCGPREFAILHHLDPSMLPLDGTSDAPILRGLRNRAWAVNQQSTLHLRDALGALARAEITAQPIRGSSLLLDPSITVLRPVARVDLWVAAADWPRSLSVLASNGWTVRHPPRASMADAWLEDRRGPVLLTWGREFPMLRRTPPEFPNLDATPESDAHICAASTISPTSTMSLAIAEGITAPSTATVTWPLDAVQVLARHAGEPDCWSSVLAECSGTGYGSLVATGLGWLSENLGTDVPHHVLDVLASEPADDAVMRGIAADGLAGRVRASERRRRDIRRARRTAPWSSVPAVSRWASGIRFLQASSADRARR